MHVDEIDTDPELVRQLIQSQFPQWADLSIEPVAATGTDNALYRLGGDLVVRLPRIESATRNIDKEHAWLPRLGPHLPLPIPKPVAIGLPSGGLPMAVVDLPVVARGARGHRRRGVGRPAARGPRSGPIHPRIPRY